MLKFPALLFLLCISSPAISNTVEQLKTELAQEHYDRAAKTGLSILRQQPDNVQVKFLTAVAFQYNNQTDIAQRYYQQIIQDHPQLPEPRNNLAMIQMSQGHYDQAIDLLIASMKTHPAYATAWQNLNLLYQGLASEAYRKALSKEKNPRSVMEKIQLSVLSSLHNYSTLPAMQPQNPTKAVQLTEIAVADKTPVIRKKLQKPYPNDLIKPLQDWALAWSQKEFFDYINAYSKDYKGKQANHQTWVEYRQARILKPGAIKVELTNFEIKSLSNSRAIIDFHQSFKSATYRDKVIKRVHLSKINNSWKITRESTVAVL